VTMGDSSGQTLISVRLSHTRLGSLAAARCCGASPVGLMSGSDAPEAKLRRSPQVQQPRLHLFPAEPFAPRNPAAQPAAGVHYYYVRVQQVDGQLAWASPMWIDYSR
jgi:hypothetical protein